jgi:hypothetical protein
MELGVVGGIPYILDYSRKVEPHGQSPWHLTNAQAGRHPGQELAHSSTAKGRGFLLPG